MGARLRGCRGEPLEALEIDPADGARKLLAICLERRGVNLFEACSHLSQFLRIEMDLRLKVFVAHLSAPIWDLASVAIQKFAPPWWRAMSEFLDRKPH
jgi:hypothetical protein